MPVTETLGRRQCIPIIYTRGTHYEVGYDVGRTFSGLIHSFINDCDYLNDEYLPAFETNEGRKAYEDTLNTMKTNFPQYVREIEGTADGAQVPFHKLFLLNMDDIIMSNVPQSTKKEPIGCSTICMNKGDEKILAHTEDARSCALNHFYFVSAHIIEEKPQGRWKVKEEKFTSLCYAGHMPGYTMSYNHHGFVFSINTLSNKRLLPGKSPRQFITRALLAAENFCQAQMILRDSGVGAGDGCSINMTFLNQEGDRLFHNAEMAPADKDNESQLSIITASPGENLFHCNMYLRLNPEQSNKIMIHTSEFRHKLYETFDDPKCRKEVESILGCDRGEECKIFFDTSYVFTIAVGIFDCNKRTWSIYSDNPTKSEPLVVLPLVLKN